MMAGSYKDECGLPSWNDFSQQPDQASQFVFVPARIAASGTICMSVASEIHDTRMK